ncbi:MAG: hypothetical protein AB7O66_22245 [Limisphaerales bacterium]
MSFVRFVVKCRFMKRRWGDVGGAFNLEKGGFNHGTLGLHGKVGSRERLGNRPGV